MGNTMDGCKNAMGMESPESDMMPPINRKMTVDMAAEHEADMAAPGGKPAKAEPTLREILEAQDSTTSAALIEMLTASKLQEKFDAFAKTEGDAIRTRDAEDADKLAAGIKLAIGKGVLKEQAAPTYYTIDVVGKTAEEVADELVKGLGSDFKGGTIVLVGLSGTGKGTTMDKLKETLPKATTWSNGNVFRSLTLLAVSHCLHQGLDFNAEVLTPENIATWMGMIKFGWYNGKHDIHIKGLGQEHYVSQVANTVLKGPMIGKNIPTVAEVSQGEVVKFASNACKLMGEAGVSVLLEGREQTVNYIESKYRFELVMSDVKLIGQRRAAQRIGAKALELMIAGTKAGTDAEVVQAVHDALSQLAK